MELGKSIGFSAGPATRDAFGQALQALGHVNARVVVVDGDVSNSTRTEYFAREFPDRFFNVGIAESNLIGVAAGLAASGKIAVAASFAVFLLCNAYEQIRMGVAFPELDVKLVGSHSGISIGEDGPSQMAIEDLALALALPGLTVLAPADAPSTRAATRAMMLYPGPVYLRTGRPPVPLIYPADMNFEIGKANLLRQGNAATVIACGLMVAMALEAADRLSREGIEIRVVDMHTLKPVDRAAIVAAARETGAIVTAEEHLLQGGLAAVVSQVIVETYPVPMASVGIRDRYAESGSPEELLEAYGLTAAHIVAAVRQVLPLRQS